MASLTARNSTTNLLHQLADETLLDIGSYILGDTTPRFEGVIECITPDDAEDEIDHEIAQVLGEFRSISSDLRSLALTSRRLRPISQELLFRAPILYDNKSRHRNSSILNLFRTLVDRPDLAKFVRTLRINVPWNPFASKIPPPDSDLFQKAVGAIDRLHVNSYMKDLWKQQLHYFYPHSFCGLVLALVPKLERLRLAPSTKRDSGKDLLAMLFGCDFFGQDLDLVNIPGLHNMNHLKLVTEPPFAISSLRQLPLLDTLDISIEPFSGEYSSDGQPECILRSIKRLRLDCRIRKIGLIHEFFTDLRKITLGLENLQCLHLYGEPSFYNHYTDLYHNEWAGWYAVQLRQKSYSGLLKSLDSIAPTLETLELPRGFWTLPNVMSFDDEDNNRGTQNQEDVFAGETTNFRKFTSLKHLIVPKTAIVYKTLWTMALANPIDTLPPSLETIRVFGADEELWPWLEVIVDNQPSCFPHLIAVEFLQGEPMYPKPMYREVEQLKVSNEELWDKLVASGIKLSLSC